jgi:two-component system, OmpR family, KDP operon response regulator KdpE
LAARQVIASGKVVHLTPNEFRLLTILVKHAGKVLTHRQLLQEVWGPDSQQERHYLRVYMNQLRQKLEQDPTRPIYLLTEPGVGYRLVIDMEK